jgi:competence protein ComEA
VVLYTRHQVLLLLAIVATVGSGMAVGQWRRTHLEAAACLEQLDHVASPEPPGEAAPRAASPEPAAGRSLREPGPRPRLKLDEPAGRAPVPLDLNRASAEEMTRLPGVGPTLAARIVEARDAERFGSVEDLRRVRGLGRVKFERLRPFVTVGGSGAQP